MQLHFPEPVAIGEAVVGATRAQPQAAALEQFRRRPLLAWQRLRHDRRTAAQEQQTCEQCLAQHHHPMNIASTLALAR